MQEWLIRLQDAGRDLRKEHVSTLSSLVDWLVSAHCAVVWKGSVLELVGCSHSSIPVGQAGVSNIVMHIAVLFSLTKNPLLKFFSSSSSTYFLLFSFEACWYI